MTMMVAFAANAVDYYLIGGFNGWSLKQANCKFTDAGDGTYTLDYNGTLTTGFKINDGTWSGVDLGGNGNLVVGTPYSLVTKGGNIGLSENIENPHIVLNPTNQTLLITGQQVEATYTYDIWGSLASGTWASTPLTEKDGKWVAEDVTVANASASFGIRKKDADSGAQVDWFSAAGNNSITEAGVYELKVEGSNFDIVPGTWSFTFDPEAMTLTVAGEGGGDVPTPNYTYGLWGSFGTGSEWSGIAMTEEDGKWVADVVAKGTTNFGIQRLLNGEQVKWLWSADNATITEAGDYAISVEGSGTGSNFGLAEGTWHFSFDPEAMTLVVTGEGGEVVIDYTKWYLNVLGDFNEWKDNGVQFNEEGIAILEDLAIGTSPFKLKIWTGTAEDWRSNGQAIDLNTDYVVEYNWNENMTIADATEDAVVSVKFDAKNNVMFISGTTAVAEVEVAEGVAEYYNLQGVKVANPENGIYVKVLNGKATKVVVK